MKLAENHVLSYATPPAPTPRLHWAAAVVQILAATFLLGFGSALLYGATRLSWRLLLGQRWLSFYQPLLFVTIGGVFAWGGVVQFRATIRALRRIPRQDLVCDASAQWMNKVRHGPR